jgi:hypothetical protein
MATTTNYGWATPDDTALVKDGASAIRTLGSSVDTTTKALNPSTTLGDIEYRSSTANTNTRLGIGSTGQVLTVASGVPSWATPASGSTFVGCGVKKTDDQSINTGTYTVVSWASEDFDTNSMHDNATNNTRITIPTGKTGYYLLTGGIAFNSNGTGNRIVRVYKNGADLRWLSSVAAANTGNFTIVPFSQTFSLTAGDYLEIYAYQTSGGSLSVMSDAQAGTFWQVQYLGA